MEENNKNPSFSKKIWNFIETNQEEIELLRRQTNLSELNARILSNRGLKSKDEIENFLDARLRTTMPDPSSLLDMDKAVSRVVKAIRSNEKIFVFGDYDVDGITSTYIIVKYLRFLGVSPKYQLPDRFSDGYGLSQEVIGEAIEGGYELIIVVDSGVNEVEAVEKANSFGLDVVILEHHIQSVKELPKAAAVVNPNRIDQTEVGSSHIKHLCAAGVAFLFIVALQRELRNSSFFADTTEPNLYEFLSIVTLGTLCDVMEIKGVNRAFIKFFLKAPEYPIGLKALMDVLKIDKIKSADDFSYFIGPALNAAGRVGNPVIALNMLLEEDYDKASEIASKLLEFNKKRKLIEKELLAEALVMIEALELSSNNFICVSGDGWHEGVIGILAGKIKDKFQRPTFVISFDGNGVGKGSARSVLGAHLGEIFEKAKCDGLLLSGGGHALAGGFSVHKDNIEKFTCFLKSNIGGNFENYLNVDYSISAKTNLNAISSEISMLEPFGKGIEKPIFALKRVRISSLKKTSNNTHLMVFFSGEFDGSVRGIIFNISSKNSLLIEIEKNKDQLLDVAAFIKSDEQYGSSLIIEDIRLAR